MKYDEVRCENLFSLKMPKTSGASRVEGRRTENNNMNDINNYENSICEELQTFIVQLNYAGHHYVFKWIPLNCFNDRRKKVGNCF